MNKNKKYLILSFVLILVSIIYTILVKFVDVQSIGDTNTNVGFASINQLVFSSIGVNKIWYDISDILGLFPILSVGIYALIGLIQLIKRKNIFKVDKEIIALGVFYVLVIALYVFFEKVIINYRPVLVDGVLEASYPSSHTLMSICLCGSAIILNNQLFKNKTKLINILLLIIGLIIIVGRLLSGVHWFTDILGGVIISCALLMTFYTSLKIIKEKEEI